MSNNSPRPRNTSKLSPSARGWIPNYHGAWAMITVPVLLGTFGSNLYALKWQNISLLAFWWVGYFVFFAGTLYLKTHFRRGLPPLLIYTTACIFAGIFTLLGNLWLLRWAPIFLPLIAVALLAAWNHREREILNDLATITAACLMLPVSYQLRHDIFHLLEIPLQIWVTTFIVALYFLGTIFYVKTNIRKRRSKLWLSISIIFHLLSFILVITVATKYPELITPATGLLRSLCMLWLLILIRAIVVPIYGKKRNYLQAKVIGIGEFGISLALFIIFLLAM